MTNSQWQVISEILKDQRKRKYSLRLIVEAIFYLSKTGCQWRLLPTCYPPSGICFYYYQLWTRNGKWAEMNRLLVEQYRVSQGRLASPSVGIIDSQSVKNSEWGVQEKGFDGYKRIQGRKCHIIVDTLGCVIGVKVTAANIPDSKVALQLCQQMKAYPRVLLADGGYQGKWIKQAQKQLKMEVKVVKRNEMHKNTPFKPLPQRWKVERTISWLQWNRRLAKDYECDTASSETQIYIANIYRLLKKF
jgi:putative transposase